jgi:D-proline reductase (dithiol) PrdB
VCHQTVSLVARHLEENGLATVVLGSARDVVEECGVPRFLFSDFPLGNPSGKPWEEEMQRSIVGMALDMLSQAFAPRTTIQTPFVWGSEGWRGAFMRVDDSNRQALAREGQERRRLQAEAKAAKAPKARCTHS